MDFYVACSRISLASSHSHSRASTVDFAAAWDCRFSSILSFCFKKSFLFSQVLSEGAQGGEAILREPLFVQ